jgi:hypothetical protein
MAKGDKAAKAAKKKQAKEDKKKKKNKKGSKEPEPVAAVVVAPPVEPETAAEPEPPPPPPPQAAAPETGLGDWSVQNEMNVRSLTPQGTVLTDDSALEKSFSKSNASGAWVIVGRYDAKPVMAAVVASAKPGVYVVKGSSAVATVLVQTILDQAAEAHDEAHVDSSSADEFRIDHDIAMKQARVQGNVSTTFELMRFTLGPPKPQPAHQVGWMAVEWRMLGKMDGRWTGLSIKQSIKGGQAQDPLPGDRVTWNVSSLEAGSVEFVKDVVLGGWVDGEDESSSEEEEEEEEAT